MPTRYNPMRRPQPLRPSAAPFDGWASLDFETVVLDSCGSSRVKHTSAASDFYTYEASYQDWCENVDTTDYLGLSMNPFVTPPTLVYPSDIYFPAADYPSSSPLIAYSIPACGPSSIHLLPTFHPPAAKAQKSQRHAINYVSPTAVQFHDGLPSWGPPNPPPGWTPEDCIDHVLESPAAIAPLELRLPSRKREWSAEVGRKPGSQQSRKRTSFVADLRVNPPSKPTTPFITKLVHLLSHSQYHDLIKWNSKGTTILFLHASAELLACFSAMYRHANASSFIRQLNIYGFNRAAVMDADLEGWELEIASADISAFSHPHFFRDTVDVRCDTAALKPRPPKAKAHANGLNKIDRHASRSQDD